MKYLISLLIICGFSFVAPSVYAVSQSEIDTQYCGITGDPTCND